MPGRFNLFDLLAQAWRADSILLHDIKQFDVENERGEGWNGAAFRALGAIGEVRGNVDPPLVADLHLLQGFGPARNDAVDGNLRRLLAQRAVEALAVQEHTVVMDTDDVGDFGRAAGTFF